MSRSWASWPLVASGSLRISDPYVHQVSVAWRLLFKGPMKHLRTIAIRALVVIGALATIATSAPNDFELTATVDDLLSNDRIAHISVVANAIAVDHADDLLVEVRFNWLDGPDPLPVLMVPDDPSLPTQELRSLSNQQEVFILAGLLDQCTPGQECEMGFSFELVGGVGSAEMRFEARMIAIADPSFIFPEDRDFPSDATIEARIDE